MKSAYELAMERLNKTAPTVKLTEAQKRDLAEIDSIYAAKIAEREIFLKGELSKAIAAGDMDSIEQVDRQLSSEKRRLQAEMDEKKERIRNASK